jgi:hypothetical protein
MVGGRRSFSLCLVSNRVNERLVVECPSVVLYSPIRSRDRSQDNSNRKTLSLVDHENSCLVNQSSVGRLCGAYQQVLLARQTLSRDPLSTSCRSATTLFTLHFFFGALFRSTRTAHLQDSTESRPTASARLKTNHRALEDYKDKLKDRNADYKDERKALSLQYYHSLEHLISELSFILW